MAIYLPASAEEQDLSLDELTPREIVAELDKHVVGQRPAKRAVAIALLLAALATSCPRTSS